jgi:hypothetical protein
VPLRSRYASMSTDPHERFTLLSFDGFADDESSERSAEGLLRSTGAMHFRSADHLGRHDLQGVGCAGLRATLDLIIESLNYAALHSEGMN